MVTMRSAMSREGIPNAMAAFLATAAGRGAENDPRAWARANRRQQFVKAFEEFNRQVVVCIFLYNRRIPQHQDHSSHRSPESVLLQ